MRRMFGECRVRLGAILLRAAGFATLWWLLAEGRTDGWALGAAATALATWASLVLLPLRDQRISPVGVLRFLGFFVFHSLRGGVQVATMALHGRAALRPAMQEMTVTLPPGGARVLLVNSLGLMPGTLGVEQAGETLRLHVLDERLPVVAEARALEAAIEGIFGAAR